MQQTSRFIVYLGILIFALCATIDVTLGQSSFTPPLDVYWPNGGDARCVNLTDVPLLYPGAVIPPACYDYVLWPESVYVDNNTYVRNVLGRLSMSGSWTSPECLQSVYLQFCTLLFRPCTYVPVPASLGGGVVAVAQNPCFPYCTRNKDACRGTIIDAIYQLNLGAATPFIAQAAVSCTPPWNALYGVDPPGSYIFPNSTYNAPVRVFQSNGSVDYFPYTLPCYDGNINITSVPPQSLCPDGMYFRDGFCIFECPEPIITDSEYDAVTTMLSVMGWISLVSAAFLAFTFLMDPDKRRFPANLSIYFILCIMCLSFSFCLGSMAGWRDVWCDDNDKPNLWGGPACTIQGIIFVYFTLASVLWWLVLSVNLLLMVTRIQPNTVKLHWTDYLRGLRMAGGWLRWETLYIGYHIFAWVPPLIPLIIALGAHRLGYNGHDLWCTIHSDDPVSFTLDSSGQVTYEGGDPANIWNLLLLTVPILTIVAVGLFILIFVVIWGIWKLGWRFFHQQWRLFLFIMFFIWIYTFVFSFQIHLAVQTDKQYQSYTDYINCQNLKVSVESTASPIIPAVNCPDSPDSEISFPLWFIVAFNEASQGLLLFLLYGTSLRFFKTWYILFTNPKALISSKYSTSSGDTSKKAFSVVGRRVGKGESTTSTHSQHMVDEIGHSDSESSSDSTSSEAEGAAESDDEEKRERRDTSSDGDEDEGVEMDDLQSSRNE